MGLDILELIFEKVGATFIAAVNMLFRKKLNFTAGFNEVIGLLIVASLILISMLIF